uniref:F-box domain-containing protein n=1 Tax=Oryza meridionalis TaxID=40149 RepID=A0A0E0DB55_9ORYZ
MVKAARTGLPPRRRGLPEEIVVWEILVRLPPKPLLRCRLVCRAWRRLTSTGDFLLTHHRHQPSLPLVDRYKCNEEFLLGIVSLDRRAAAARLQPVAQLDDTCYMMSADASCDGLLLLSIGGIWWFICNPITRQFGALDLLCGFMVMGFYKHPPTSDYRLLLYRNQELMSEHLIPGDRNTCYVYTLGSSDVPRCIGWPETSASGATVVLHGSLHWYQRSQDMILVFDTTAESFRWMLAPSDRMKCTLDSGNLFDMDGKLGMYCSNDGCTIVDIWVLQDYKREIWSLKYQVELPVPEIRGMLGGAYHWSAMVLSQEGDVLVLVSCDRWLFYIDTEGNLLASFQHYGDGLFTTGLKLKPSLVQHAFFPLLDSYAVNASPFI